MVIGCAILIILLSFRFAINQNSSGLFSKHVVQEHILIIIRGAAHEL